MAKTDPATEWSALNDAQKNYLRHTASIHSLTSPDQDPASILEHVSICPSCQNKMRIMGETGKPVLPPRRGHDG